MSVLVLGTVGYGWSRLHELNKSVRGGDVIADAGPKAPDGATDILLVGNDSRVNAQGEQLSENMLRKLRASSDGSANNLTDTMILVRIPDGGRRASAVSFPRDTLVDLDRFGEHKLNSALARAQAAAEQRLRGRGVTGAELARKSRTAGQKFFVSTIEELAGVDIDHYAEVNLLGFYRLTKAVGGVKVCLRRPVDDSEYSGAVFPAGPQVLSGSEALAFVRQRHGLPRGDLDRVVRQQAFLAGLANKILSAGILGNPAKVSALMDALENSVTLDKGWNIVGFAGKMRGIAADDIEFSTIPVRLRGGEVVAKPKRVERYVDDLLSGRTDETDRPTRSGSAEERPGGTAGFSGTSGLGGDRAAESETGARESAEPGVEQRPTTADDVPCVY
ncbi:LCP family protein required for cell wall assembly [Saccharopolyspora lacisalsi]|uniref:LCP family protein required for cell wall assembly n=1 Tax=Halosaccharopolyspora lacisalsi TaxID=1000566 RepID=A0A839DVB2_9PSEU|nr:LCP family protein required for cell wall assembly [Halosaccharopolyspora lacisalsi]